MMREMTERLADDAARRRPTTGRTATTWRAGTPPPADAGVEPLPPERRAPAACRTGSSACTRSSAHELAAPGTNLFGREALAAAGRWWSRGPCVTVPREDQWPRRRVTQRVAAIDCGTNSIRLLIADIKSSR